MYIFNTLFTIYVDNVTVCTFFFFNDPATTEIYTLSLHDALPIFVAHHLGRVARRHAYPLLRRQDVKVRSEEHTSELQSPMYLVCRLLLEKKKKTNYQPNVKIITIPDSSNSINTLATYSFRE